MIGLYEDTACLVCGDPTRKPGKLTCGRTCSYSWNAWRTKKRAFSLNWHVCNHCGKRYQAKRKGRDQYCSRGCFFAAHPARPKPAPPTRSRVYFVRCDECGETFTASRKRMICSDDCRSARASRRTREAAEAKHQGKVCECRVCGNKFEPEYGTKRRRICSDLCKAILRRDHKGGKHKHRGRARHYGVEYEPINRQRVYRRDAWRCGICGEKIDRRTKAPHPRSASLDHIVPMAEGGGHVYANVQAAHFLCNSIKGAKSAGEQLLLVG